MRSRIGDRLSPHLLAVTLGIEEPEALSLLELLSKYNKFPVLRNTDISVVAPFTHSINLHLGVNLVPQFCRYDPTRWVFTLDGYPGIEDSPVEFTDMTFDLNCQHLSKRLNVCNGGGHRVIVKSSMADLVRATARNSGFKSSVYDTDRRQLLGTILDSVMSPPEMGETGNSKINTLAFNTLKDILKFCSCWPAGIKMLNPVFEIFAAGMFPYAAIGEGGQINNEDVLVIFSA